jgi:hypothetical protein
LFDTAEPDHRLAARLFCAHASLQIVVDVHLEMALQFGSKLALAGLPTKNLSDTDEPCAYASHDRSFLTELEPI